MNRLETTATVCYKWSWRILPLSVCLTNYSITGYKEFANPFLVSRAISGLVYAVEHIEEEVQRSENEDAGEDSKWKRGETMRKWQISTMNEVDDGARNYDQSIVRSNVA